MNPITAAMAILLLCFMAAVYILPSYLAWERKHPMLIPILIVNLAFGWTFVGWFISLALAYTADGRDGPHDRERSIF